MMTMAMRRLSTISNVGEVNWYPLIKTNSEFTTFKFQVVRVKAVVKILRFTRDPLELCTMILRLLVYRRRRPNWY